MTLWLINLAHVALFLFALWLGPVILMVIALPLSSSAVFANLWWDAHQDAVWFSQQYEELAQSVFDSRHAG